MLANWPVFGARAVDEVYSSNRASTFFGSGFRSPFKSTERPGMMGPYVLDCTPEVLSLLMRRGLCCGLGLMRSSTDGFCSFSFPFDMMLSTRALSGSSTLLQRIFVFPEQPPDYESRDEYPTQCAPKDFTNFFVCLVTKKESPDSTVDLSQ